MAISNPLINTSSSKVTNIGKTIKELKEEVGGKVKETLTEENIDKAIKETGDATEEIVDYLIVDSKKRPEGFNIALAFISALANGYSFGLIELIAGETGLGKEMRALREKYPNVSTAGDLASILSPGMAAKLWVGATKMGVRGLSRLIRRYQGKTTASRAKQVKDAYEKFLTRGPKNRPGFISKIGGKSVPAGDLTPFISEALGMSKGSAKKFITKHKITGRALQDAFKAGVSGTAKLSDEAARLLNDLPIEEKVIQQVEKFAKASNIGLTDVLEVYLSYNAMRQYYLSRGHTEEEANAAGWSAATAHLLGKGVSTQIVDRVMPRLKKGNLGWMGRLTRVIGERAGGVLIYNLADIEEGLGQVGEAIESGAQQVIGKAAGGLVSYKRRM